MSHASSAPAVPSPRDPRSPLPSSPRNRGEEDSPTRLANLVNTYSSPPILGGRLGGGPGEVGREATGEIEQPTLWIAR
jgi:hypothetical protein